MARNGNRQTVCRARRSGRLRRTRCAGRGRELTVRQTRSGRNAPQRFPDAPLKGRAAHVEIEVHVRCGIADELHDRRERRLDLRTARYERRFRKVPAQMREHVRIAIAEFDCRDAARAQRHEHAAER